MTQQDGSIFEPDRVEVTGWPNARGLNLFESEPSPRALVTAPPQSDEGPTAHLNFNVQTAPFNT